MPGAGQRSVVSDAVFQAHQHLRRSAHQRQVIAEFEQEHVGRWIGGAQGAVNLQGAGFGLAAEALRQNNLEGVAIANILLRPAHAVFMHGLLYIGARVARQVDRWADHRHDAPAAATELRNHLVNAGHRTVISRIGTVAGVMRVGQDSQLMHGVVEDHQGVRQHERRP